jgi:hypothetical protein
MPRKKLGSNEWTKSITIFFNNKNKYIDKRDKVQLVREWILLSEKTNWESNVKNRPLNYKCKVIFKSKRNEEKLIDG